MDVLINRCRCGREIPFDPARKKQHRYCAVCRARIGGNKQRGHKKLRSVRQRIGALEKILLFNYTTKMKNKKYIKDAMNGGEGESAMP
ncbi:MAG: hypothetical protein IJT82_01395 [Schwartzia sp.]|nr:hypothetical protein [Schwartzia sp. (in: firmicutes)]